MHPPILPFWACPPPPTKISEGAHALFPLLAIFAIVVISIVIVMSIANAVAIFTVSVVVIAIHYQCYCRCHFHRHHHVRSFDRNQCKVAITSLKKLL